MKCFINICFEQLNIYVMLINVNKPAQLLIDIYPGAILWSSEWQKHKLIISLISYLH